MNNYKMIDYDHLEGGSPCNGNLSDVDGPFQAHWTFGDGGEAAAEARTLEDGEFALLWDGIAASVNVGGVFGRCLVTDPTRLVDPDSYHVVTTTQVRDGWLQHRAFMVPSSEADPAFVAWLDALAVPGGVQRGHSIPARASGNAVRHADAAQRDRVSA